VEQAAEKIESYNAKVDDNRVGKSKVGGQVESEEEEKKRKKAASERIRNAFI